MPETKIESIDISNLTGKMEEYAISPVTTDAPTAQKETYWVNTNWTKWLGYYNGSSELGAAIDAKATWTVGKGFKADAITTLILDQIDGNGSDTFNTILENDIRTYHIGGDSYDEIIRDPEGNLINLKPLCPGNMRHVFNRKARLIRFDYLQADGTWKEFQPEEIFYLPRNRISDEMHGHSLCQSVENVVLKINATMDAYQEVMERFMKPRYIFHLDTDNETEIAAFKTKCDKAWTDGENIYVPKGVVVPEIMAVAPNQTLNPLSWIDSLNDKFWEAVSIPRFFNPKTFTEAASRISYLALQQPIEEEQLFIEEQVLRQLNLVIELEFPVSLEHGVLSSVSKEASMEAATPEDTTME